MIPALVEGHLEDRAVRVIWRELGRAEELIVRNAGGGHQFWIHARRYNEAGKRQTVLGLADLEQAQCAASALAVLGHVRSEGFKLRLAVRMLESWLMADREAFAGALGVPIRSVPGNPDLLTHPKKTVIDLARHSRKNVVRAGLVPSGSGIVGSEYVPFMAGFIGKSWSPTRARVNSPSLERACLRWSQISLG